MINRCEIHVHDVLSRRVWVNVIEEVMRCRSTLIRPVAFRVNLNCQSLSGF